MLGIRGEILGLQLGQVTEPSHSSVFPFSNTDGGSSDLAVRLPGLNERTLGPELGYCALFCSARLLLGPGVLRAASTAPASDTPLGYQNRSRQLKRRNCSDSKLQ